MCKTTSNLVAVGEFFISKSIVSARHMVHIIVLVSVTGLPSLKEGLLKGSVVDVKIVKMSQQARLTLQPLCCLAKRHFTFVLLTLSQSQYR